MKGISIWWRGSGSVPWRGGDQLAPARPPVRPRAGCFQPFPARRPPGIYIFSSSRGGADSCGANAGSLAGGWLLPVPFYGPSSPRCGLGPAGSARVLCSGKNPTEAHTWLPGARAGVPNGYPSQNEARGATVCGHAGCSGSVLLRPTWMRAGCSLEQSFGVRRSLFKELLPLLSWSSKSLEHQQPDPG